MARKTKQVLQVYSLGTDRGYRVDPLGPFTTDENTWRIAEDTAELHVAGWLHVLAGRPVPGLELATLVYADGLTRKRPHPEGRFVWQCEGAALLIATGLDSVGLDVYLSDYRTAEGRIDRKRDASSIRAARICADMNDGMSAKHAIARHRPTTPVPQGTSRPVPPPTHNNDAEAIEYYRSLIVSGEVCN